MGASSAGSICVSSSVAVWVGATETGSTSTLWVCLFLRENAVRSSTLEQSDALPRLMLVTRHEHRGILNSLNQAHLCAARQAQHCTTSRLNETSHGARTFGRLSRG